MTKRKPTVSSSALKELSNKTEELSNKVEELRRINAESMAFALDTQKEPTESSPSRSQPLSLDFSVDRHDNSLRTVHITGSDGKKRVHRYRTRAPPVLIRCIPPASISRPTQTLGSRDEIERLVSDPRLYVSAISTVCTSPEALQQEPNETTSLTPPSTPILGPVRDGLVPCIPPASLTSDDFFDNKALRVSDSKRVWAWLQIIKPLVIPLILMLITPWLVSKHLILPWFIGKASRIFRRELAFVTDKMPAKFRRSRRTVTTLAVRIYDVSSPLFVIFVCGLLMPWSMWKRFYVLWVVLYGVTLARREERTVLLAWKVGMLGVLPAVIWLGAVPWLVWRVAEMAVISFCLLPGVLLKVSVVWLVMVGARN